MAFSSCIHIVCQSCLVWMLDDIWKAYKRKFLQIFIIWPWDIGEVTSNTKVIMWGACEMTFDSHLTSISHDQVSPPPHQIYHMRWMWDDFWFLPHVHLAWPSVPSTTPKLSCEVDARWLLILTLHPSHVTKCPLHHTKVIMRGGREMTFDSHLTSISRAHIEMSPPPTKVTSHKHFLPCVTILISCPPHMPPPCKNNIFYLMWKNSQKSHAATPIPSKRYLSRATN